MEPLIAKHLTYPDERFIALYFRIAEALAKGEVRMRTLRPLLEELGVEPYAVKRGSVYVVRVKT